MSNVNKSYFLFGTSQNTSFILNHVWLKYKALWCLRRCFLRTLLWAVAKLQYEQVWGFSPVWVNRWRRTWFDRPKILEQTGHENLPLSIFMGSNFASIICNHNNKNCFICKCCTIQHTIKNSRNYQNQEFLPWADAFSDAWSVCAFHELHNHKFDIGTVYHQCGFWYAFYNLQNYQRSLNREDKQIASRQFSRDQSARQFEERKLSNWCKISCYL